MCEASRRRRSRRDRWENPRDREALRDESAEVIGGPQLCFSTFGEEKRLPHGTQRRALKICTAYPPRDPHFPRRRGTRLQVANICHHSRTSPLSTPRQAAFTSRDDPWPF